jgi:hypothetical protein
VVDATSRLRLMLVSIALHVRMFAPRGHHLAAPRITPPLQDLDLYHPRPPGLDAGLGRLIKVDGARPDQRTAIIVDPIRVRLPAIRNNVPTGNTDQSAAALRTLSYRNSVPKAFLRPYFKLSASRCEYAVVFTTARSAAVLFENPGCGEVRTQHALSTPGLPSDTGSVEAGVLAFVRDIVVCGADVQLTSPQNASNPHIMIPMRSINHLNPNGVDQNQSSDFSTPNRGLASEKCTRFL